MTQDSLVLSIFFFVRRRRRGRGVGGGGCLKPNAPTPLYPSAPFVFLACLVCVTGDAPHPPPLSNRSRPGIHATRDDRARRGGGWVCEGVTSLLRERALPRPAAPRAVARSNDGSHRARAGPPLSPAQPGVQAANKKKKKKKEEIQPACLLGPRPVWIIWFFNTLIVSPFFQCSLLLTYCAPPPPFLVRFMCWRDGFSRERERGWGQCGGNK